MAVSGSSRALNPFICHSCRQRLLVRTGRQFSTTASVKNERGSPDLSSLSQEIRQSPSRRGIGNQFDSNIDVNATPFSKILEAPPSLLTDQFTRSSEMAKESAKPHRLHVYAHKHNTHITLVQPQRSAAETASSRVAGAKVTSVEQRKMVDTVMSLSTGNIGFRKAGRGSYDAAFQLAAFALKQMQEKGMMRDMNKLEVILRGFGAGREAVTKALLGTEGRLLRNKITAVVDATRLKHGGPRSKKPRRLG